MFILAHDLGTSGNKATLYDFEGRLRSSTVYEYPTYYPGPNCVEQDPEDWWKAVCVSTRELIEKAGINKKDISCITFSAQMMGCLPVDKQGNPLRKTIIWADTRSVKQAEQMEKGIGMEAVYRITGHRVSASYSVEKLLWVKDNEPENYKRIYKVLHAKDYIIFKLTGKMVTDYSDASGMNLYDINKKEWSDEIIDSIGIERGMLPDVHPSTDIAGGITQEAAGEIGLLAGTPVVIGGGDGCCAAAGAGVSEEGKTYNVVGSSSWIATASKMPVFDESMRTFNWIHLDPALYSPCGTMQTAGYSFNWLKNTLCGLEVLLAKERSINPYVLIDEKINESVPGANNLLFLPYLLGERSPRWNPDAKGAFVGLKMTHTNSDIYRSVLEGVAFNLKVILDIFNSFKPVDEVIVIGGGAKGKVWMRILADIWQRKILVPEYLEEATSMGAAICGGAGIGVFKDFMVINKFNPVKTVIEPRPEFSETYNRLYEVFNEAYEALVPIYSRL
ncbi:MAG: xylulokinase [Clostridia bacterium]|nr:xylulokinase [Clostridia bacterium]